MKGKRVRDEISSRKWDGNVIGVYKPAIHADEIGLTSDKYIPINESIKELPLALSYAPMSLQRFLLMSAMEESLHSQSALGFTPQDLDDVRRLISDTSIYLLGATVLASVLHLLFEFLAFRSDISFWQNNKSLAGLSSRAVISELFSQTIIFMFLVDSDTSLLVTIPVFFGILIQMWKVKKATGIGFKWGKYNTPTIHFYRWEEAMEQASDKKPDEVLKEEELTHVSLEADRIATTYLGTLLFPMAVGFTVRTLLVERHTSWYSWGIGALTGVVYTFGFVLMCPQLFINHKLKTVSYMPWKFMVYRFLNTFIDDLFAFIIKMPTMHRLSVFRDDIVFLIYMYQRYIYRVDTSRPVEK